MKHGEELNAAGSEAAVAMSQCVSVNSQSLGISWNTMVTDTKQR